MLDPAGFAGLVVFAGVGGLLLHRILGWYIEGAVTAVQCLLIVGAYLAAIGAIVVTPSPLFRGLMTALVAGVFLALPFAGRWLVARGDRAYYDEMMEGYRAAIDRDPRNLAARSRLADALYKSGRIDEAIYELTELVRMSPRSLDDARRLGALIQEREERQADLVNCRYCGEPNPRGRTRCSSCERELDPSAELKERLRNGGLLRMVISFSVAMAAIMLLFLAASLLSPIGRIAVVCLLLLLFIGGGFIYIHRRY